MTDNKDEDTIEPMMGSELLEIGAKDIGKIKDLLDKGTPLKLEEKTASFINRDLDALPKVAQEKIQIFVKEIAANLEKPGFADASQMTAYISGLIDAPDSTAFSTLHGELSEPSNNENQGTSAALIWGVIFLLADILFVLLVLLGLKTALTGRPDSGGGGDTSATPGWWNTVIHGPNGPITPTGKAKCH